METQVQPELHSITYNNLLQIEEIEKQSFDNPWSYEEFFEILGERNNVGYVLEDRKPTEAQGKVIAYLIYGIEKDYLEILNFAVRADKRRIGIASRLIEDFIKVAEKSDKVKVEAKVSEKNLAAQIFFRKKGFRANETIKNYYLGYDIDALLFEYFV
jgi:ribosomal protein S18 acetylase RimI-like enzyme